MTEDQYITAKDLGHILSAKDCLKHVVPENSKHITTEEYTTVMMILQSWADRHFENIKLEKK